MLETGCTEIKSSEHIPPKFVDVVKKAGGGEGSSLLTLKNPTSLCLRFFLYKVEQLDYDD